MQCVGGYHVEDDVCVASDTVCSRDAIGRVECNDWCLLQTVMSGELFVGVGETTNCAVPSTAGARGVWPGNCLTVPSAGQTEETTRALS